MRLIQCKTLKRGAFPCGRSVKHGQQSSLITDKLPATYRVNRPFAFRSIGVHCVPHGTGVLRFLLSEIQLTYLRLRSAS